MIYWIYIIAMLAVYLFYKSYQSYKTRNSILAHGKVADGEIIEIKVELTFGRKGKSVINRTPIMQYTDHHGVTQRYKISTQSDLFPYSLHARYKLVFDPEGKHEPIVMTHFGLWGDVIGYFLVGLFLLIWVLITALGK